MIVRETLKAFGRACATVVVVPSLGSYCVRAAIFGRDRALEGSTQALSLIPGVVGQYLRCAFLARTLDHCAPSATIGFGVLFSCARTRIDDRVYIGPRCHIGLAHFEADVLLGSGVHVPSGRHTHGSADPAKPIREQEGQQVLVRIGAGSWIGNAAVVMADVGKDTIVGAGAVVTKPLPDRVVAGGVPARILRRRDEPT